MNRRSFVAAMSIGLTVGTSSVALAKRNTPSEGFDEINAEIDNVIDLCDRDISCLRVHSTRILQLVRQFKRNASCMAAISGRSADVSRKSWSAFRATSPRIEERVDG